MVSNLEPGHADSEDHGKLILSALELTLIQDFKKRENSIESMKIFKLLYFTFIIANEVPIPCCVILKSFYHSEQKCAITLKSVCKTKAAGCKLQLCLLYLYLDLCTT